MGYESRAAMTENSTAFYRRRFVAHAGATFAATVLTGLGGCVPITTAGRLPDLIWGRQGLSEGRLMKPRAMTIDEKDHIYVVDLTGRIQVFDADGVYLRGWRTPVIKQGKPLGLAIGIDGNVIVADTHYFRVLFYSRDGVLDESRTIGGVNGDEPGQFQFVTDVVQAANGHFYIGHYGQSDMIQEFDPVGHFVRRWGTQGSEPGQFSRPQTLVLDKAGLLWITDACNHRIQVFSLAGPVPKLERIWGTAGSAPGQLQYPYGLDFDADGSLLIAEFGNHRVQRFSPEGKSLELWGGAGKEPGQFTNPWALIVDSKRRLHVLDSLNHRVQRFPMPS